VQPIGIRNICEIISPERAQSKFHHPPFHLVLQILCNEFLNLEETLHATSLQIRPPLGVEGLYDPAGEIACFNGVNDIGGGLTDR
jgi:hypothetical protein